MSDLTLGSLFDGSGGFPLGGLISGIEPLWASEIEPFPIRVTTKRLPFMKHYGDVSKLDGAKLPPVDIITFGSPCQDMSVAGKRAGLDGSRSSLFYEAVRIVKEMRCATDGKYPRYIVWENVPGAFSSNKGADFQSVLEEICSVKGYEIDSARPAKWPNAGEIVADDFSLAWRVFDAQYWGVPQRRKRIYLVADFAGGSAGKILFESEGLSGYSAEGFRSWQRTARTAEEGAHPAGVGTDGYNGAIDTVVAAGASGVAHPVFSSSKASFFTSAEEELANTLVATDYKDPPIVNDSPSYGFYPQMKAECITFTEEKSGCLVNGTNPGFQNGVLEADYIVRRLTPTECARLQGFPDWWCAGLGTEKPTDEEMYFWYKVFETWRKVTNPNGKPKTSKQVRKWLSAPYSDSAEYKMWGNGVALPCVVFVLSGIVYYSQFPGE